jgi:hypothetical protein
MIPNTEFAQKVKEENDKRRTQQPFIGKSLANKSNMMVMDFCAMPIEKTKKKKKNTIE